MLKKLVNKILVVVMLITTFTIPISADYTNRTYGDRFDGETFYVQSLIYTNQKSSRSTTNYGGTNIQIYVKNTSLYGDGVSKISTNIGYDGGTLSAYAYVSTGYAIYSCTTYGNVKYDDDNMIARTITVVVNE